MNLSTDGGPQHSILFVGTKQARGHSGRGRSHQAAYIVNRWLGGTLITTSPSAGVSRMGD
jgi:ribosomal protein S2